MATTPTPIPTPAEITVSQGYRIDHLGRPPHDREIPSDKRDRVKRWVWLISSAVVAILAPVLFFAWFGWLIGIPKIGAWAGIGFAIPLLVTALRYGLIRNPQQVGLASQNTLTGEVIPYGPGIHPSFAWEEASEADNIPLQTIEHVFPIEVPTTTALAKLEILLMWRPALENLDHFTNVKDDEAV